MEREVNRNYGERNGAESAVFYLNALLHYHERMMCGADQIMTEQPDGRWDSVDYTWPFDGYADALREAIRCVKEVNGL